MSETSVEYVIYIHAVAEEVWNGLVDPELTQRYWMHENISDWKPGSPWQSKRTDDAGTVDVVGHVLESEHPQRLTLSWAQPGDADNPTKTSRVTFEIEAQDAWPHGPWVGLTLTHSELEPDSDMLRSLAFGWPAVMSGLKTVIESPAVFDAPSSDEGS